MLIKISKFFLYATAFTVVIVSTSTLFPFIVGKYTWFRASVDFALIAFLLALVFDPAGNSYWERLKRVLKSPLGIMATAFAGIFLIAGFFGVDPALSFWSTFERGEGGLQILHLYALFLLLATLFTDKKSWMKIFWFSLIGALFMGLYGVFAGLGSHNFLSSTIYGVLGIFSQGATGFIGQQFSDPGFRLSGSIGNSAYVAAYIIFVLFYTLYLLKQQFGKEGRLTSKVTLISLLLIFIATFVLAATRGAFIGLIVGILAVLAYLGFSKKTWRKWLIIAGICFLIVVGVLVYFQNSAFVQRIPGSRIFTISFGTNTFATRRIIWSIAWHGFLARPILGWGPENFLSVFDRHFNIAYFAPSQGFGAWFDRAHSIFFDYLVETGILGVLSYFGMFAAFFIEFFRRGRNQNAAAVSQHDSHPPIAHFSIFEKAILFAVPIAYLVQGMVLFDILPLYLNLFLFFAFAEYLFLPPHKTQN